MRYACQIWGQSKSTLLSKISSLQNKAMRLILFQTRNSPCNILYFTCKILRFYHLVQYLNCLFAWEQQHSLLPTIFDNYFENRSRCGHNLRSVTNYNLTVPLKQTITYMESIRLLINVSHPGTLSQII